MTMKIESLSYGVLFGLAFALILAVMVSSQAESDTPPPAASPVAAPPSAPAPSVAGVKYCEEIGDKLDQYTSKEELFSALTQNARRLAVAQLLQTELARFSPQVLERDNFIDTLTPLIEYSRVDSLSEGLLKPCVVLIEAKVDGAQRAHFNPMEIGRLCSFDGNLLKKQSEEMKEAFISRLFDKKNGVDKPPTLAALLVDADKTQKKFGKDLLKLLHEENVAPPSGAMDDIQCISLRIYPIELYALSAPYRKEAETASVDPPVAAKPATSATPATPAAPSPPATPATPASPANSQ
jgi:hypothetical protein